MKTLSILLILSLITSSIPNALASPIPLEDSQSSPIESFVQSISTTIQSMQTNFNYNVNRILVSLSLSSPSPASISPQSPESSSPNSLSSSPSSPPSSSSSVSSSEKSRKSGGGGGGGSNTNSNTNIDSHNPSLYPEIKEFQILLDNNKVLLSQKMNSSNVTAFTINIYSSPSNKSHLISSFTFVKDIGVLSIYTEPVSYTINTTPQKLKLALPEISATLPILLALDDISNYFT